MSGAVNRITLLSGFMVANVIAVSSAVAQIEPAFEPVPRSTVVESDSSPTVAASDFVIGSVDKIKRDVSFERAVRIEGIGVSVLYEIPESTGLSAVISWYREQIEKLNADVVFECAGRDCGRATVWSSEVFQKRVLGATDQRQHYFAVAFQTEAGPRVAAIYMVQRGNRRIYSYVVETATTTEVQFNDPDKYSEMLARHGSVVLDTVEPNRYGKLTPAGFSELERIAGQFATFSSQRVYVVCVLFSSKAAEELLEDSTQCAEEVAAKLDVDDGVDYVPFGAGPLFPDQGKPRSRILLVAPHLLRFE